jgi:hypothetical protein
MAPAARACARRLARASIAMIPCPTAGKKFSVEQIDGGGVRRAPAVQPGERQQGGGDLAGIELAQARLHMPRMIHDRKIGDAAA